MSIERYQPDASAVQASQGNSLARYLELAETLPTLSKALAALADDVHSDYIDGTVKNLKAAQPMINSLASHGVDPEVISLMNRSQAVYVQHKLDLEDVHLGAFTELAKLLTRQR